MNSAHRRPPTAPACAATQVPKLQLKWAFGFPNGSSAYGQPAVAGGRVFVGSDNGFVYSLDAATGCVYWSFEAKGGVRTAISLGTIKTATGTRHAAYFGDLQGQRLCDRRRDRRADLDASRRHASVRAHHRRADAGQRPPVRAGVVVRRRLGRERQLRVLHVPRQRRRLRRGHRQAALADLHGRSAEADAEEQAGTQLYEPSGVAIWSAPTIDVKRNALYVATGNEYSGPGGPTSDAVIALDLDERQDRCGPARSRRRTSTSSAATRSARTVP